MELKPQRLALLISTLAVWALVIAQAVMQPFVHDEARVYFMFVQTLDFFPFFAKWDAGNHVLPSIVAALTTPILGVSHASLRSFSVLCFPLYAFYAWRCSGAIGSRFVRWSLFFALIGTPFLLEFFSLFRGYGPGIAFLAMALFHVIRWTSKRMLRDLTLALVALMLAVWSNLSLVLVHGVLLGFVALTLLTSHGQGRSRSWLILSIVGIVPWVLAVAFGQGLADRGALYYGSAHGLVDGTLVSLLHFMIGSSGPALRWATAIFVLVLFCWGGFVGWRSGPDRPLVLFAGVLALELLARFLLFVLKETPYPIDRTALHLGFLFMLLVAAAVDEAQRSFGRRWSMAALLLPIFPLCAYRTFGHGCTAAWSDQQVDPMIIQQLADRAHVNGVTASVGAHEFLISTALLEASAMKLRIPLLDPFMHPNDRQDLLLMDTLAILPSTHKVILRSKHSPVALATRSTPCGRSMVRSMDIPSQGPTTDEFVNLFGGPADLFNGQPLLLELQGAFETSAPALMLDVVVERKDTNGASMLYQGRSLQAAYHPKDPSGILFSAQIPAREEGTVVIYLWNPERIEYAWERLHIDLSTVHCE